MKEQYPTEEQLMEAIQYVIDNFGDDLKELAKY